MSAPSAARKAFVAGHPIAHSRSPLIHQFWLRAYNVAGSYQGLDIAPDSLPELMARLRAGEFVGGNLTLPLKEIALAHCDTLDSLARQIGAVNTLVLTNRQIAGSNSDYQGFLGNLDQHAPGWSDALDEAIVLGAGGAARAIVVALAQRGVRTIHILNRTAEKADALARHMNGPLRPGPLSQFSALAPRAGLLVNTTSIGMFGTRFDALPLARLPKGALVTDIVYVPLITPLLSEAAALGLKTVDGLGMLLHQAVPGFEAWFGIRPEVTAGLRQAVEATL